MHSLNGAFILRGVEDLLALFRTICLLHGRIDLGTFLRQWHGYLPFPFTFLLPGFAEGFPRWRGPGTGWITSLPLPGWPGLAG